MNKERTLTLIINNWLVRVTVNKPVVYGRRMVWTHVDLCNTRSEKNIKLLLSDSTVLAPKANVTALPKWMT